MPRKRTFYTTFILDGKGIACKYCGRHASEHMIKRSKKGFLVTCP